MYPEECIGTKPRLQQRILTIFFAVLHNVAQKKMEQVTTYSSAGGVSQILYQLSCKWLPVPVICLAPLYPEECIGTKPRLQQRIDALTGFFAVLHDVAQKKDGTGNHLQLD